MDILLGENIYPTGNFFERIIAVVIRRSKTNDGQYSKKIQKANLASKNIVEHWTAVCRNWDMVSNYLTIMFADRQAL